jgi:hypothetical protein
VKNLGYFLYTISFSYSSIRLAYDDYGKFRITDERVTNGEGVQNGEEKGNRKKDV